MKRRLVITLGTLAAVAVALLGILFWQDALELWHISRLDARDASASSAAAEALVGLKSARAAPVLLRFEAADQSCPFVQHARRILAALDRHAYDQLARRLRHEPDERLRADFWGEPSSRLRLPAQRQCRPSRPISGRSWRPEPC